MSANTQNTALERFIPLVDFLGAFLGHNCEVVLHDTSRPESSVVAIANSHISGRRVGSPITDMALQLIKDGTWKRERFVTGYKSQTANGRPLHSATYFITEDDKSLAGMLCLNMDNSSLLEARNLIERFLQSSEQQNTPQKPEQSATQETFPESLEELTGNIILQVINSVDVAPERMTPEEKMEIVRTLNEKGVFLLKGTVTVVAGHLCTSEATIYRYLHRVAE